MSSKPEICLLECLMPPDGFQVECIVGTTYNLSPSVILSIIVASSINNPTSAEFDLEECSKEEILNAIRENQNKCLVFCDHHGALEGKQPFTAHEELALNSVVKKEGRNNNLAGSLHSKLLVTLFKNSKNEYVGRVFVGSKNLTESTYKEFGIVLELSWSKEKVKDPFVRNLSEYLEYLNKYEAKNVSASSKLSPLRKAISLLKSQKLELAAKDVNLYWQGRNLLNSGAVSWKSLGESLKKWLPKIPDEVYIHSPWSRAAAVKHIMQLGNQSTRYFIKCLDEPCLSTINSKQVSYEFYYGADDRLQANSSHAKIYLFNMRKDALLAFGSANCTPDAWGLRSDSNATTNSELMVTMFRPYQDFKYIAEIKGNKEIQRTASKALEDKREKILDYLSSINAELHYDTQTKSLSYSFFSGSNQPKELKKLQIIQSLVEPFNGSDSVQVFNGKSLPSKVSVGWERGNRYLISPKLIFRDAVSGEEAHLILDLDLSFFEGREKLKCLSYSPYEFIESLAQLMDVPLDGVEKKKPSGEEGSAQTFIGFLSALRIERYAYRMARLKRQYPLEYASRMTRIETLLRSTPSQSASVSDLFSKAIIEIEKCHKVLNET